MKCRPMNSESQSRNYTVFVSGLIVHLFAMRNCRHWPCSRWLTYVYRACTSDGKWSSFLGPMAKWLCDLCKFHSNCNTENVNVTCFGRISSEVTFNRYKIGWSFFQRNVKWRQNCFCLRTVRVFPKLSDMRQWRS